MSSSNIIISINNQDPQCCICYQSTPTNTNFSRWNCIGQHSDTICNKCHSHIIEQRGNCPLCRATL